MDIQRDLVSVDNVLTTETMVDSTVGWYNMIAKEDTMSLDGMLTNSV